MKDSELLMESVAWATENEDVITLRFYEILFERYPAVRPLFSRERATQAKMLQDAIVAAIEHMEDAEWLSDTLGAIGATHVDYGVQDEMYPWVGECLVAALAEQCGDRWTPQHQDAWVRTYGALQEMALAGAARRRAEA
jgi:hemoglobin-like flavoprotein